MILVVISDALVIICLIFLRFVKLEIPLSLYSPWALSRDILSWFITLPGGIGLTKYVAWDKNVLNLLCILYPKNLRPDVITSSPGYFSICPNLNYKYRWSLLSLIFKAQINTLLILFHRNYCWFCQYNCTTTLELILPTTGYLIANCVK